MNLEVKNKIKKGCLISYLIVSSLSLILVIIACIVGFSGGFKSNVRVYAESENVVNINRENKKLVSYDDEHYKITLTANEASDYSFNNFYTYIDEGSNFDEFRLIYQNDICEITEQENESYVEYAGSNNIVVFILDNQTFNDDYELGVVNHCFLLSGNNGFEDLSYDLIIDYSEYTGNYAPAKLAIELDIQANESNINDSIFGTLTTSVVAFISSLSSGIVAMTNIFYTNNALTVIGLLSVIVVAVALAYWLFRLIIGLIRMRG